MMHYFSRLFLGLSILILLSCNKEEKIGLYSVYQLDKYRLDKPVIDLDTTVWEKQTGLMANFPRGITIYKSSEKVNSKNTNMYLLAFNPRLNIDLKPVVSTVAKTPTTFFNEENGEVYACVNGGFFSGTTSLSLVMYNSAVGSVNVKSLTRVYNGANTTYYPTRAAFGLDKDYKPSVSWVYSVGTGNGELYAYPQPSPNAEGQAPQIAPTASFPEEGALWTQTTAIGGSPMLIRDSIIHITDVEEMITTSATPTSSRPRTAIGHLKNGNVVLFVAEGGSTNIPGLTLQELAQQMLSLGCVGAVNLDGGGSSSLVVDGETTIKPSDAAGERKVISALIVKKR
ncbi:phosphodiester glycosidase family protein [Parapedobacter sp. SGR-10]|nr:phosphodiester glycosidase family protein [Parapedobacter sp. SGR-10]